MLRLGNRKAHESNANSGSANLRRLTRERRVNVNLVEFSGNSGSEDADLMKHTYRPLRNRIGNSVSRDDAVSSKSKRAVDTKPTPRQEVLRPRRSKYVGRERLITESDDGQDLLEDKVEQDETGNEDDVGQWKLQQRERGLYYSNFSFSLFFWKQW